MATSTPDPVTVQIPGLPLPPQNPDNQRLYDRIVGRIAKEEYRLQKLLLHIERTEQLLVKYAEREGTLA